AALQRALDRSEVEILFVIRGGGGGKATFWTCDLTHGYIDINARYRT
ncbi:MAG: bifunctional ornithine acetyltransferase/N-acetylglutamate synthase, partial [Bryobacteraceae bacterium]